ncbi:MAG: permease [Candidatus Aminicenantes bacterium]|nr:permease [Candidatus Aminicenantes bacterium]
MKIKAVPAILAVLATATVLVWAMRPDKAIAVLFVSKDYLLEMISILPPVLILCGLFDAWVPRRTIEQLMGDASGIKGTSIAFLLGTVAMGPLYAAFPIGKSLLDKGASLYNVAVFLCVWASIKIPMILFEVKFLGAEFALLRLALTIPAILVISALLRIFRMNTPRIQCYR